MGNTVYSINKGINKAIEFRGLKAQYIGWLAGGLVGLLLLFAVLYIVGLNAYFCVGLIFILGGWFCSWVYRLSKKYGQHGMMKKMAARRVPKVLVSRSRRVFMAVGDDE